MTESREAVRERVRKFRELKKKVGVTVTDVTEGVVAALPTVTESLQGEELLELRVAVIDLGARVAELERRLSPEEVSRSQALKPGSRPNDLYGA